MNPQSNQIPVIACRPDAIDTVERPEHFELARNLLFNCGVTKELLPNGIVFRLPADSLDAAARFVANERRCCPFMTFDIKVEPNGGSVSLSMTGPIGTREVIEAELGLQDSCGCK